MLHLTVFYEVGHQEDGTDDGGAIASFRTPDTLRFDGEPNLQFRIDLLDMLTMDDVAGTHMADERVIWQYSQIVAEANPEFYIEHMKRLRSNGIQAYFAIGHVHCVETGGRIPQVAGTTDIDPRQIL
jgi:hypothetical protein